MENSRSGRGLALPMEEPPINGWAAHPNDCDPILKMGFFVFASLDVYIYYGRWPIRVGFHTLCFGTWQYPCFFFDL